MVNILDSIETFKRKYLREAIELKNKFNGLVGESIHSVYFATHWDDEKPLNIENGNCEHVPFNGINILFNSGNRILIFDSNTFSEFGGTFGIDIKILNPNDVFENQDEQTDNKNWSELVNKQIESIEIIWLDDDGWQSSQVINGRQVMVTDKSSMGIFPHGIKIKIEDKKTVYILAVEPEAYIESEKRYKYLRGGEEFVIAFGSEVAQRQKLIIEGIKIEI